MKKIIYPIIVISILIFTFVIQINNYNKMNDLYSPSFQITANKSKNNNKDPYSPEGVMIEEKDVPIKMNEIDYKIVQEKNKDGYVLAYINYKNNSKKYYISDLQIFFDSKQLGKNIELYYGPGVGPHKENINYDKAISEDLSRKIPIKDSRGNPLRKYFNYEIKQVNYSVFYKNQTHRYRYNLKDKTYNLQLSK